MKKIVLILLNTLSLIFALVMNFLGGSGIMYGKSVGDVSQKYNSLFTPAGYAFSIWGIIYLLLILYVGYQWVTWYKKKENKELFQAGIWFALSNIANGLWIIAWLNESFGISVILMFILLFSLVTLTIKLRLEIWDAPVRIIAFIWWPICIYLGWIIVASVANVAVFLFSFGWNGLSISAKSWTVLMIVAATVIYLLLIYFRNMRESALVGVWALIAIASKQWHFQQSIVIAAVAAAAVLFIAASVHGYLNRETSPFEKIRRGEV